MMEWLLPELVAAQVAQHLSPRDLAACCGVSRHWRLIFDTDQVWKPLCDPHLEEPLRTTPCVVEPPFSLPEPPDSTLAPVCQWRAAFLREQHLQTNYRNGNYKTVQLKFEDKRLESFVEFVSNDFLMRFCQDSVELFDVRVIPPISVDKLAISSGTYSVKKFSNGFVILENHMDGFFQVLKVDLTEGTITSKYWIHCTDTSGSPEIVYFPRSHFQIKTISFFSFQILTTPGTRCIGYFMDGISFHIFDLESGIKVREQFGLLDLDYKLNIVGPKTRCYDCHDVLVFHTKSGKRQELEPEQLGNVNYGQSIHCYVYDVDRLIFLPFKRVYWDSFKHMFYGLNLFDFSAIMNDFVALTEYDDNTSVNVIRIFNYRTGDQIHFMEVGFVWHKLDVIDSSCFLLVVPKSNSTKSKDKLHDRLFGVILPSGVVVEDFTGESVDSMKVICRKQVIIESRSAKNTFVIWQITQREKQKFVETALKFDNIPQVNQTGTILTYGTDVENEETKRLVYLW